MKNNGIGKEHPYQQIKDGETAARLALDEVLKLSDKEVTEPCAHNPNYVFGSWFMGFHNDRHEAMKAGRTFTREEGEAHIFEFFHPSPEEIARREAQEAEGRRKFEEQVTVKREETGCWRDDGLYKIEQFSEEFSIILVAFFVDESSVVLRADGTVRFAICPKLYAPMPSMAEKWYNAGGLQKLGEIANV
jgi:hypothetical protein